MSTDNLTSEQCKAEVRARLGRIDEARISQLAGICQAMGIIKLTSEALHELPAVHGTIASVAEALDGAYAILDGVLGHCETIEKQIRGEVAHV